MSTETNTTNASFGYWVRRRRKALDLTQDALGALAHCSGALIRKIEADERRPSAELAESLAKALAIEPAERAAFLRVARGERAVTHLDKIAVPPLSHPTPPASLAGNLPVPPTSFVGRQAELATLAHLLQDPACRLLTIAGAGGMGKTRLALALAHQEQARFTDGVCFVNLAAVAQPELVAAALATALGLTFAGPTPQERQVIQHLRAKQMLLVLDNFEHLLDAATLVGELLTTAANLNVVVTSREPLGLQAEWVFTLDGLATATAANPQATTALASAVELFVQRARQVRVGFQLTAENSAPVQEICQLVEGLPLAIELAASWVRTLPCAEIARQIAQDLNFLVTTACDLPPRHRSMTAVFEHSWRLLSVVEQQTLSQLALFQGGFSYEAAQAVAGASLLTLSALVSKSLVRMVDGRYDLHELVRQFAAAQLVDGEHLRATQRRHAEYYLHLLYQREAALKSATQVQVMAELQRELGNVRQAWTWAGDFALWTPLFRAIRCYWAFYDAQGLAREGGTATAALLQQLTPQVKTTESVCARGRLLCYCGFFYFRQGDNGVAHTYLERSIHLLRPLNDPALLIDPLVFHGVVLFLRGETAAANAVLDEGLRAAQAAHEAWFEALALLNRGYLAMFGEATPAIYADMQQALAIWRRLGGLRTIGLALAYLSPVAIQLGQLADAQRFLDECLPLAQQIGDRWLIGTTYSHQAMLAHAQGALDKATRAYQQAMTIFQELHLLRDLCIAQVFLGEVQMQQGETAAAQQTIRAGMQLAQQIGAVPTVLAALLDLAMLPETGTAEERLVLVAFVQQHPVKTHRLTRDTERLWAELAPQLSPAQLTAIQAKVQTLQLETLLTRLLSNQND